VAVVPDSVLLGAGAMLTAGVRMPENNEMANVELAGVSGSDAGSCN